MEILSNEVIIVIISAIAGAIPSAIIVHIFYNSKLKKEQKIRFQNVIGDRIAESLLAVRDIELKASIIEIHNIENEIDIHGSNFDIFDPTIYPAVMSNKQTYSEFFGEILNARIKYGNDIDRDVALYLWYAERYFTKLNLFIAEYKEEMYPDLGCIFIVDIQKWQLSFHKTLIKKINSTPTKIELHSGLIWNLKKKRFMKKFWNSSLLNRIINNDNGDDMDAVWGMLEKMNKNATTLN